MPEVRMGPNLGAGSVREVEVRANMVTKDFVLLDELQQTNLLYL